MATSLADKPCPVGWQHHTDGSMIGLGGDFRLFSQSVCDDDDTCDLVYFPSKEEGTKGFLIHGGPFEVCLCMAEGANALRAKGYVIEELKPHV